MAGGAERTSARAASPPAPAATAPDEPAQWLDRMNKALTSTNYDGTYSLWLGGKVELLRIIHRVQDGVVSERLVSLDGSGREFIRTGGDLTCYLPESAPCSSSADLPRSPCSGIFRPSMPRP